MTNDYEVGMQNDIEIKKEVGDGDFPNYICICMCI